jgi:hypothetical protein
MTGETPGAKADAAFPRFGGLLGVGPKMLLAAAKLVSDREFYDLGVGYHASFIR